MTEVTLEKALSILREHNRTGKSVMRLTGGAHLEKDLLEIVLNACSYLNKENGVCKELLQHAVADIHTVRCISCKHYRGENVACCVESCTDKSEYVWRDMQAALRLLGKE
jgi:predicted SprT family Zn-dependent metalloprotease